MYKRSNIKYCHIITAGCQPSSPISIFTCFKSISVPVKLHTSQKRLGYSGIGIYIFPLSGTSPVF